MNDATNRRYMRNDLVPAPDAREDPLAELARIVNKNDPFSDLFNEARTAPAPQPRIEPSMTPAPAVDPFEAGLRGSYDARQEVARPATRFRGQAASSYGIASYDEAPTPANTQSLAGAQPHDEDVAEDRHGSAPRHDVGGARDHLTDDADSADGERTAPGHLGLDDDEFAAPYVADEDIGKPSRDRRGRGFAGVAAIAGLIALAAIGGGAAYVWKSGVFERSTMVGSGGAPPLIVASREPTKIKPEAPAPADAPPATKEIFDRVGQEQADVPERILPREEQPVALVPSMPQTPRTVLQNSAVEQTGAVVPPPVVLPTRGLPPAIAQPSAVPQEPRRVKTVKVLSDGTIVTGEAPAVAAMPPLEEGVPSLAIPQSPADPQAAAPDAAGEPADAATQAPPSPKPAPVVPPVRPRKIAALPKPAASAAPAPTAPAPQKPAQAAALETPETAAAGGGFVVQVSSQKSQADAIAAFQSLQRKFPSVVSGMKPSIRKADVGDKGTFFRVRVGAWGGREQATAFCVKLKAAGGDCVVTRN